MVRKLLLLLLVICLTAVGIFLIKNDGVLEVTWLGYYIQASTTFISVMIFIIVVLLNFLLRNLYRFYGYSHNYKSNHQINNYKKAVEVLFSCLDTIMVGSVHALDKRVITLKKLLPNKDHIYLLKMYIESEAIKREGNAYDNEFEKNYVSLALNDKDSMYALKQMALVDREKSLHNEALFRLEAILKKANDSQEVLELIIDSLWQLHNWDKVIEYIRKYEYHLFKNNYYILLLILAYNLSGEFELEAGNYSKAHKAFQSSLNIEYSDYNNEFATIYYIKSLFMLEKYSNCQKFILQNWSKVPLNEVATIFLQLCRESNVKIRMKHMKQLLDVSDNHPDVVVLYVDLLIKSKEFDRAKDLLLDVLKRQEHRACYDALIKIEELTYGNPKLIQRYKEKGESAKEEIISWQCASCGEIYTKWKAECFNCKALGKISIKMNH